MADLEPRSKKKVSTKNSSFEPGEVPEQLHSYMSATDLASRSLKSPMHVDDEILNIQGTESSVLKAGGAFPRHF